MATYHIYAIRLSDDVLQRPKFMERNPHYKKGKPCYYIGSSIYPPKVRFDKHKAGERSSRWVRDFGLYPAYKKCKIVVTTVPGQHTQIERQYAAALRAKGYGVWQN